MMNADFLYTTALGRLLFKCLQKAGIFRVTAWFLRTKASRHLIPSFIEKNGIDMKPFKGQTYDSFASFFARERSVCLSSYAPDTLSSLCDSMLSVYPVTEDMAISMKGSVYTLTDLIPDVDTATLFRNGLCLVFRLRASDYHHFCCFDDGHILKTAYIPGQLHSVQPIALRHFPVFRLNRRWWSLLDTEHFGRAAQIEIGAMMVGGVSIAVGDAHFSRGDEMGHFELAGSTIVLLLDSSVRKKLVFEERIRPALNGETEVEVQIGSVIGSVTK